MGTFDLGKPALWGAPSTPTTPGQARGFPTQRDTWGTWQGEGKEGERGRGRGARKWRADGAVPAERVVWEVAPHEEVAMAGATRAVPGEGGH